MISLFVDWVFECLREHMRSIVGQFWGIFREYPTLHAKLSPHLFQRSLWTHISTGGRERERERERERGEEREKKKKKKRESVCRSREENRQSEREREEKREERRKREKMCY